jgi:hypothetical protein
MRSSSEGEWTLFFYILDSCRENRIKIHKKAFNEKGIKESPGVGFRCPQDWPGR